MSIPSNYKQIVLNNAPSKEVNLKYGEESSTFRIEQASFDENSVKDGEVVVKVLYLSNDPTQRGWMQKGIDAKRMYAPPILENDPVTALGLGEIVLSKSSKHSVGDKVTGRFSWQEYVVVNEQSIFTTIDESAGLPLTSYLSSVGMTGLTAYFGVTKVGELKKGQTIVISAASGATGSMCVQIAKHIVGASKVIGISGSAEKCKWVESLGADVCVNYHDADYQKQLSDIIGDDFVDVYYDNVGGEILSFMLSKVKPFGHVVACGAIAGYNDSEKSNVTRWGEIITNRLTVRGFIILDFVKDYAQGVDAIVGAIKEGKIKITEGTSVVDLTSEKDVLAKVPETWSLLFGSNKPNGKLITKIA